MQTTLSFWEKQSFLNYDLIITGGGIVGLSTAVAFAERYPQASVLVLERGLFPSGASTKNAGFACFGSLTELLDDLQAMPPEEMLRLVQDRWEGLQLLRQRLGDRAIGFKNYGGYELLTEFQAPALQRLEEVNKLLYPLFDANVFSLATDKLKHFGFATGTVKYLVENRYEGQIDTGKMMKALQKLATQQGIEIITGASVIAIKDQGENVAVSVQSGWTKQPVQFIAGKVAVCTNAFARELLPDLELVPGRGQVLITKPVPDLPFKGVFHYDEGYYYFRNYGSRIILGGGRNLDKKGEETTEPGTSAIIQDALHRLLREVIIPGKSFEAEHTWSGIMAFGKIKKPIIRQVSANVVTGVRLGGMGIAIGSLLGKRLADLLET
ncbi:MAG: FAD-dependent oxidoreductase [Bacteroidia bacterium]